MSEHRRVDPIERAHLRDARGFSPPVHRFAPSPDVADLVRRYWLPVWSLPAGETTVQRVLQYPVCLLVVAHDYAHVVGPTSGLSTRELSGSGWAAGVMLQPASGTLLLGGPVTIADQVLDLGAPGEVSSIDGARMVEEVRREMASDPSDDLAQRRAVAILEQSVRSLGPVDEEGALVNAVVEYVEGDSTVQRVGQVCEKFSITERSLQRLTARRIGLSPKWLVQRRRLHEAAEQLATGEPPDLARVAVDLGYSDQAHFTRDFRTVTGLTPGGYAAERRARRSGR